MGLLKGNAAYTMFRVVPRKGQNDYQVQRLANTAIFDDLYNQFAWLDGAVHNDALRRGWVSAIDPSSTDPFSSATALRAFSLREDKVSINPTYKKICIRRAEEAWKLEHGVERVPRTIRTELKDDVTTHLLERALPAVSLTDVLLDPEKRRLYIFASSASAVEATRAYFSECFDVSLELDDTQDEGGKDFLLWLWMHVGEGSTPEIWAEDRLTLLKWGTGEKTIVVDEDPAEAQDALRALVGEKRPCDFRCVINDADLEYKVAVVAEGDRAMVTKLGLPATTGSSDPKEKLDERISIFLGFIEMFARLQQEAADAAENSTTWQERVNEWIETRTELLT